MDVVVIGSFMMDLVVKTPRAPLNGETIIGSSFNRYPGGKGANQVVSAARLGSKATFIGKVGNDLFGKEALQTLENEKVNIDEVKVDDNISTGIGSVTLEENGDNRIIVVPGANLTYSVEELKQVESYIKKAKVVVLQLEIDLKVVETAVDIAYQHGVPTILNPAPACELSTDLLEKVTYLTPNESEATLLTGKAIKNNDDAIQAAHIIRDKGVSNVIITLGDKGALIVNENETTHIPGYNVIPVDTVAAGDSFNGALANGLVEGKSLKDAVKYANAVGALTITKIGAIPSLPTKDEVDNFIKEQDMKQKM